MSLLKPFHLEELIKMVSGGKVMRNQHSTMEKQNKTKEEVAKAQVYSLLPPRCVRILGKSLHLFEPQLFHL